MSNSTATLAPISSKFVPNISTDRCDSGSCGARANARVTLVAGGQLLFCGHHTNEFRASLIAKGAVIDEAATEALI